MAESKRVITKQDITTLGYRSSFLQASFNYERMQAGGWTWAMLPILKKVYKDDPQGLSAAMQDNLEFINTHPNLVGFLMGLLVSLEESGEDRSLIKGLKVALFGPIAGVGDAIFWFTLLPIVAGISCSFAAQGNILGPIIFVSVYLLIFFLRIMWTHAGYKLGTSAIDKLKDNAEFISNAATILGITVVGALIASYVHVNIISIITVEGGITVPVQEAFFDRIFPNLLPVSYTMLMFYLLKKKQVNPVTLILGTIALAILGSLIGIL